MVKSLFELGSDKPTSDWTTRNSRISNVKVFIHRMKTNKSYDIELELEYEGQKFSSKKIETGNTLVDLLEIINYSQNANVIKVLLHKLKGNKRVQLCMTSKINLAEIQKDCLTKLWIPLEDVADVIYEGTRCELEVSILTVTNHADKYQKITSRNT